MTATLPEAVRRSTLLVDPALSAALDRLHPRMRLVAAYHRGWVDAQGSPEPDRRGGKALRPALALLGAEAVGVSAEIALPAAVAVELVHDFSLLHDDVMDGDTTRRHRPTAWTVFGVGASVLAGDGLLALAGELLSETGAPGQLVASQLLDRAVLRLVEGQADDLVFEERQEVTVAEYTAMASGKTAALLSCAAAIGAALGGAAPGTVAGLADFGERLGLAFQLVDDLLGIWGSPAATGKPVLADLRARKKSAPVVMALANGGRATDPLRAHLAGEHDPGENALAELAALIDRVGARDGVEREARRQLIGAEQALADLDLAPDAEAELVTLARFVTARDR
jgi:geranylgeranyl diphosphate synthase type I